MSDSRMLFKLRRELAIAEAQLQQCERLILGQRMAQEMSVSVACAWTWDLVFGNPDPTDAEIRAVFEEKLKP